MANPITEGFANLGKEISDTTKEVANYLFKGKNDDIKKDGKKIKW